jgi:predicted nucleic acid-binding protein
VSDPIVLDATPLGLLANPNHSRLPTACRAWLSALQAAGRRVILPEITDYEVRRELLRANLIASVRLLDNLAIQLEYLPLSTSAMRKAAELWAQVRRLGKPTAQHHALDGDAILAAQALSLGVPVIVARGNPAHLARFVPTDDWQNIVP